MCLIGFPMPVDHGGVIVDGTGRKRLIIDARSVALGGPNSYVEFFYLGDLIAGGQIRWFDEGQGDERIFVESPLPKSPAAYVRYLDYFFNFVDSRNKTITAAMGGASGRPVVNASISTLC